MYNLGANIIIAVVVIQRSCIICIMQYEPIRAVAATNKYNHKLRDIFVPNLYRSRTEPHIYSKTVLILTILIIYKHENFDTKCPK